MRFVKVIDRLLSYFIYYSGILSLIERINRQLKRVPIITYHSISRVIRERGKYQSCLELLGMTVPLSTFCRQLSYIAENYQVIGLEDFVSFCRDNRRLPPNPVVISFDDGFLDNYELVYPELKRYGFKATFFIIGNTQAQPGLIWHHLLYHILDQASGERFVAKIPGVIDFQTNKLDNVSKTRVARLLRDYFISLPQDAKMTHLSSLCEANMIRTPKPHTDIYMTSSQLETLADEGNVLGAHSMNHDSMASLPDVQERKEINESKKVIDGISRTAFVPFSYPFGTRESFDRETQAALKKNGISCAVTTIEGLNGRSCDLFALKRIEVGNFDRAQFAVHLSGIVGDIKSFVRRIMGNKR